VPRNQGVQGGGIAVYLSSLRASECILAANSAAFGGALFSYGSSLELASCTFWGNAASARGAAIHLHASSLVLGESIVARSLHGGAVSCSAASDAVLDCTDIFGNGGGDWINCIADQLGINGNFSGDPLFCDADGGNYALTSGSPCARANAPSGCDLIGALPAGCR